MYINNIFTKHNHDFKEPVRDVQLLQISLVAAHVLTPSSVINLLWSVVLVEICKEKLSLYRYVVRKGRNIFILFQMTGYTL